MATITVKDLEMDATLDREAMRKVCGGNPVFGSNFVNPVAGSFQHQSLSDLFANQPSLIGAPGDGYVIPGGSVSSASNTAINSMARNVKG